MVTFRLPDFRLFHLFRDRRQKTSSGNVFPQYPGPGPIPDKSRQSQSQSGQHPVHFSTFLFCSLCYGDRFALPFS